MLFVKGPPFELHVGRSIGHKVNFFIPLLLFCCKSIFNLLIQIQFGDQVLGLWAISLVTHTEKGSGAVSAGAVVAEASGLGVGVPKGSAQKHGTVLLIHEKGCCSIAALCFIQENQQAVGIPKYQEKKGEG